MLDALRSALSSTSAFASKRTLSQQYKQFRRLQQVRHREDSLSQARKLRHSDIKLQPPNDIYIYIYIYIYMSYRTANLQMLHFIYIFNKYTTEYFKHAALSPFFSSSKCRLFHNANFFDSCIIHILNTGCAKI